MSTDLKREMFRSLSGSHKIKTFVETGTAGGETALWASRYFDKVWTIEYNYDYYKMMIYKGFNIKNISFLYGDSQEILPMIVDSLKEKALFFLDAHYTHGPTDVVAPSGHTPLISELETIFNSERHGHVIVVDDLRLMGKDPEYPRIEQLYLIADRHYYNVQEELDTAILTPRG